MKQICIDNNVDVGFIDFMEKVYEEIDPTDCGFFHFVCSIISNLPDWDNSRFKLLTLPYNPVVEQSTEVSSISKPAGKVDIGSDMERAELLSKINDLQNEIESLKNENEKLKSQIDEYYVDNECDDTNIFHIDYRAKTELIYNLLNKAGVNVTNSQAVAHLCVLLTGYEHPRTIYNFLRDIIKGNKKSNKSYWHDIDRINSVLIEGLSSNALIIQKRDKEGKVDSMPDKQIYQDDIEKMRFRQR